MLRDGKDIQASVRLTFNSLRACHESALGVSPDTQGMLTIEFVIAQDGTVKMLKISTDVRFVRAGTTRGTWPGDRARAGREGAAALRFVIPIADDPIRMGPQEGCGESAEAWGLVRRSSHLLR